MSAKRTPKPELTVVEPVEQTPVQPTPQTLDEMLAQKRVLDEQIKAAKAALPQLSKLDRVIRRQTSYPGKWVQHQLIGLVGQRVAAGQPTEEAADAVLAQYRAIVLDALATAERDEADRAYDDAYGAPRGTDATN
jgi:hypothetical protein